MKSFWRYSASYFLILFFAFVHATQFAVADTGKSVALDMPGDASLVVHAINSPADERKVLSAIAAHPESAVIMASGPDDPALRGVDPETTVVFAAANPNEVPALQDPQHRRWIDSMRVVFSKHADHIRKRPLGLVLGTVAGTGFGTCFWYVTDSYLRGAGEFAWMFLLTSVVYTYSHPWVEFSKSVGDRLNAGPVWIGEKFGKPLSKRAQVRVRRLGQALTAVGLNVISANIGMALLGNVSWAGFAHSFLLAFFLSHEIIDYKLDQELEHHQMDSAVTIRILSYLGIDMAAFNGYFPAEVFAGTTVTGFMLSFIFQEQANQAALKMKTFLEKNWLRLKATGSTLKQMPAAAVASLKRKIIKGKDPLRADCEDALIPYLHMHPW